MTYYEIKETQPTLFECFFAFDNKQFEDGKNKAGIADKKILSGGSGLYGTQEGITKLFSDYEDIDKKVSENCTPQDVYAYEFNNHECSYTCDDFEAIEIVVRIFGVDKAKEVKRRFGYSEIKE